MKFRPVMLAIVLLVSPALAGFTPDAESVQREGPAYRYPQSGWIVVHVEGKPYERGFQQGKLLAPEIAGYTRCFAAMQSPKAPSDGWKLTRTLVSSLFLHRYDPELLEEQRGIADGAAAAGAKFDGRAIDLTDIVAINSWAEIGSLDWANSATATGLEGRKFSPVHKSTQPMHCSAFAAVGPATADGKIVIGHTSMFDLYPSTFFNVWLDVKPEHGHRFVMQSYPGGVNSGQDWYINDAGFVVLETTLDQTQFDPAGEAETSRIRRAVQYGDSIDEIVAILKKGNNGLYTNEWIIADTKHNEIAMFDLGTAQSKLWRSSKHEWFGNTEGFYWGCNNAKDLAVRIETIASLKDRPANMVFHPEPRDMAWVRLFEAHKGHVDADFAKLAFSTAPLVSHTSLDAKFTTTDLARSLNSWAIFGPPAGTVWQPTRDEREKYPEVNALPANAWTVIGPAVSLPVAPELAAVDLPGKMEASASDSADDGDEAGGPPAWRGTLVPNTDADTWLASAFAAYEPIVAKEQALLKPDENSTTEKTLSHEDRVTLGMMLGTYRSEYLAAERSAGDVPASKVQSSPAREEWYHIATGRGVLMLHEMRRRLGLAKFAELMDRFGQQYASKPADTAAFESMAGEAPSHFTPAFFEAWLNTTAVPKFQIVDAKASTTASGFAVQASLRIANSQLIGSVDVTIETAEDEKTQTIPITGESAIVHVETDKQPLRLVVDKYGQTPGANGSIFGLSSFRREKEQTLIVYGTRDESATNRQCAEALQRGVAENWLNVMIPIKAESDVTEEDLKSHHVILIGRPACNALAAKYCDAFNGKLGATSFTIDRKAYGNMHSAAVFVGTNPLNDRYSMLIVDALSADALLKTVTHFAEHGGESAVKVYANGEIKDLLVPPADLVRELSVEKTP